MWRLVIREIIVLCVSLSLFPVVVILLLLYNDSLGTGLGFFLRQMVSGGLSGSVFDLWLKMVSPYLVIQAIRGFIWSQKSIFGRKWSNLYFALLLAGASLWFFGKSWDLFYLMYAMGDIPAELKQFLQLERDNLLGGILSIGLSAYCFIVFINPYKFLKKSPRSDPHGTD